MIPPIAVELLEKEAIEALPGFEKRLQCFLENRRDLARHIRYVERETATTTASPDYS